MVHAAVALCLKRILKTKADIHRRTFPRIDGRGKGWLVYMGAVQLILIGIAALRKRERTGILHPLIFFDPSCFIAAVVPLELAVVIQQANAIGYLTCFAHCHAEHIRCAPAD